MFDREEARARIAEEELLANEGIDDVTLKQKRFNIPPLDHLYTSMIASTCLAKLMECDSSCLMN